MNQSNSAYFLTRDIINSNNEYCFTISADNVVLDCGNRRIDGDGSGYAAIFAKSRTNISVVKCSMTDWFYGVEGESIGKSAFSCNKFSNHMYGGLQFDRVTDSAAFNNTFLSGVYQAAELMRSNRNSFNENSILNGFVGALLTRSSLNTFYKNKFIGPTQPITLIENSNANIVSENTLNGPVNPGILVINSRSNTLELNKITSGSGAHLIDLLVANGTSIRDNYLVPAPGAAAIRLDRSQSNTLLRNKIVGSQLCPEGILVGEAGDEQPSKLNTIAYNDITGCLFGLNIDNSDADRIISNKIAGFGISGIFLTLSSNEYLASNRVCGAKFPNADISAESSSGTGRENTCDTTSYWNDQGQTGCTYRCS